MNNIKSWSFSRFTAYQACPRSARYKFIDRLPEPGSAAMDRGSAIHKLAEQYIRGEIATLPKELEQVRVQVGALRTSYRKRPGTVMVEDSWSFRRDWSITTWDDWDGCWLRVKVDAAHLVTPTKMVITDWKTGKFRDTLSEYDQQLMLYVLAAFMRFPELEEIYPRLVYVDHGKVYPGQVTTWTRDRMEELKEYWEGETARMLKDTRFDPTPGNACRWCHFRKSNGGPCEF